ncbi:energy-coupling factor transport system ATP-binding protein [Lachnospiraceae bacterium XBB2008]|nr:energy-coupling factor transport system ATP-binding protein [Lachnospiraceae bacterium XBB2008]
MKEPIIEFVNFTFKYRAQVEPTLHNIDLRIYEGEKILIVGPSGSGKSTLSNCINGLIPHIYTGEIQGEVRVRGKNITEASLFDLSCIVGTVLQDTDGQFIGLTVAEDIAFALENDCVAQDDMFKKVDEIAGIVEVDKLLTSRPGELSGGQKQRVSMAGVMVRDVDILLFDEPLANLDPATGKRAIALIDDIQKKTGKTIVIIEHRLEDALYRDADRVILVNDGRIAADMTPDELMSTDTLIRAGIREPLYVTALKSAGITIRPEDEAGQIDTLHTSDYAGTVRKWYQKQPTRTKDASGEEVLSVRNLTFAYEEGKTVLEDVSFAVRRGEMLAIVGKNGAGKTTLSNLICGFVKPVSGEIRLNGEDISPLSVKERGERIGLVMQNPNQMISKSMIYDEVALGLQVRGVPEDEIKERVNAVLKICGLYPYRNWPISALSFGQKKRVTIAAILVMEPDIMILDEPTAGQDYRHYTEIMEFIKGINEKSGTTIIMITHDMHLMLEYTDRSVVIADGHLLADSSPASILTNDDITDRAYLKRTSLYDLAHACGIDDADGFTEAFINYERSHRKEAADGT